MKKKLPILIFLLVLSLLPTQVSAINTYNLEATSSALFEAKFFQVSKEFIISPNPATSTLNVYVPKGFENARLSVFDVLGKEIYKIELSNPHSTINISKWNSGVYLMRIATDTESQTKRFVKQ